MRVFDETILNRIGKKMHLRIYEPDEDTPDVKFAFHIHGRSGTMDYEHNQAAINVLRLEGYRVIAIDATNSQNNPSDGCLENFTIPEHTSDLEDAIKWAQASKQCSNKFLLAGHSMGGFSVLSVAAAAEFRDQVSGVIGYAPVTDGKKQISQRLHLKNRDDLAKVIQQGYLSEDSKRLMFEKIMEWADSSIFPKIDQIKAPVALIAGGRDLWVPEDHVKAAVEALPNCVHFQTVSGANHSFKLRRHLSPKLGKAIESGLTAIEASSPNI